MYVRDTDITMMQQACSGPEDKVCGLKKGCLRQTEGE